MTSPGYPPSPGSQRDSPLSATNVERVFRECLADEGDEGVVTVQGILHAALFSKAALTRHERLIGGMLDQLPDGFKAVQNGGGGGWTFLNAGDDRDGNQWTGLHLIMEELFMLGLATEQASWCMEDRTMWSLLPGQMPYVVVHPLP